MVYVSHYLLMQEIAWPRVMLEELAQEFIPKLLVRPSSLKKFKYIKKRAAVLYDKFAKYHDGEISRKSWTMLFKQGFKMTTARQNGICFLYAGPESIRILNNLLEKIPDGGGFHYDGKETLNVVENLLIPKITMPEIKVKKESNEKTKEKEPGKIIRG